MTDPAQDMQVMRTAFEFVSSLAKDLNRGEIDLPSFPEAVMQVRKALDDENCTHEKLARIAASEQVLAGRLLKMANSALLQRGDHNVTDLRTAIQRLGLAMVRNAAITVAMEQIANADQLGPAKETVKEIWQTATKVAALCYVLARKFTEIVPDEAFLAGLLHNVGKLYILSRSGSHPEFLDDPETLAHVLDDWHGAIGKSIIESWDFSSEQAEAAEEYTDLTRAPVKVDLTDVLQVATLLESGLGNEDFLETIENVSSFARMGLSPQAAQQIVEESNEEIRALVAALR